MISTPDNQDNNPNPLNIQVASKEEIKNTI